MATKPLLKDSFFSIGFDLLILEENIPYDLYINSSVIVNKERFVRIFPKDGRLSLEDVKIFQKKYHQLYIPEGQRDAYLKSLIRCKGGTDVQKTEVIKDSAIHYLGKIFDEEKEFTNELLGETIVGCRESVESMIDVIKDYDVKQVQDLIGNLSFHDFYTYDHSINVSMYCISIFQALKPNAPREEVVMAGLGGLLHDLGKIKIPTHIINNPGKLSEDEFQIIKKHPQFGGELLDGAICNCPGVNFEIIRRVILEHHENVNGTGYPHQVGGKDIHLLARITAIADFYDAITTKRSYHDVLTSDEALSVMARAVGKKIDQKIFEVFSESVAKLIVKNKSNKELPEDFDPCQPHNVLPFQAVSPEKQAEDILRKEKQTFGKVSGGDDLFGKKKKAS
jgi:HD-GYP domain-containing protein (c-di-GMP phosphodiesterase class II)